MSTTGVKQNSLSRTLFRASILVLGLCFFSYIGYIVVSGNTTFNTTITTNADLENGLVGHWTFDGEDLDWSSTTAEVLDRSGNGHHGNATSTLTQGDVRMGNIGQALYFDRVNKEIEIPYDSSFDIPSTLTVAAWINTDGTEGSTAPNQIVGKRESDGYGLEYSKGGWASCSANSFCMIIRDGATYYTAQISAADYLGEWTHLVGTYDGSNVRLYVNGELKSTTAHTGSITYSGNTVVCLGSDPSSTGCTGTWVFHGLIDDVRIYNRTLAQDDISRLYELGGTTHVNTTITTNSALENGLVGHWTFDGGYIDLASTTSEILDRSGNNNRGDWGNHATTTVPGVIGQAIEFTTATDHVYIEPAASLETPSTGVTMTAWVKPNGIISGQSFPWILGKVYGFSDPYASYQIYQISNTSRVWAADVTINGTQQATASTNASLINENEWYFLVARWESGSRITLDVYNADGTLNQSVQSASTYSGTISYNSSLGILMGLSEADDSWGGAIDDVRVYSRSLTDSEVTRLFELGGTTHVNTTISTAAASDNLILHYTFDNKDISVSGATTTLADRSSGGSNDGTFEGSGFTPPSSGIVARYRADTVTDSGSGTASAWPDISGNGYDLSQVTSGENPTIVSDGGADFNYQSILRFNNDRLYRTTTPAVSQPFYIAVVAKPTADGSNDNTLVADDGASVSFGRTPPGFDDEMYIDAGNYRRTTWNTDWVLNDPALVVGEFSGATAQIWHVTYDITQDVGSTVGTIGTTGLSGLMVGEWGSNNRPFYGDIAEVIIYDHAVTDAELAQLASYVQNRYGPHSPYESPAEQSLGRIGQAFDFSGESAYVDAGNIGTARAISFWIKTSSSTQKIINIDGTDQIELSSNSVLATSFPGATIYVDGAVGSTIDSGWHHVVVTDSTGVSASTFEVGRVGSGYFDGVIDDVRVYSSVLSASEIQRLYESGN